MVSEIISISDLSFDDIFQIYVVQGFLFAIFLIIGYNILKRGRTRINLILSGFYLSMATGFFINFISALILIDPLAWILYLLILFFLYLGTIFLLIFTIMIKTLNDFNKRKQNTIILIYSILLIGMGLIPGGLTLDKSTDWYPIYSDVFIIYLLVVLSISFIPALIVSFQTLKSFENEDLKRRWKFFIIGTIFFFIFAYGTLITYKLTFGIIILIWSLISFALITLTSYFIYYGVAHKL